MAGPVLVTSITGLRMLVVALAVASTVFPRGSVPWAAAVLRIDGPSPSWATWLQWYVQLSRRLSSPSSSDVVGAASHFGSETVTLCRGVLPVLVTTIV